MTRTARICSLVVRACIVTGVGAGCGPRPDAASTPVRRATPPPELHHGIDVSWHSGEVDWAAVAKAGHTFAVIKASEGVDLKDKAFERHWAAAGEAGLVRGAYHFYVTEDDPEAQAALFLSMASPRSGDLAPTVDIEVVGQGSRPGLPQRLRRWLEIVGERYRIKPIIYTSKHFWDAHLDDSFSDHPLWVAEYGVDAPMLPVGWDRWHLWQWQGDATVPGVEKTADLSKVNLEVADLHRVLVP